MKDFECFKPEMKEELKLNANLASSNRNNHFNKNVEEYLEAKSPSEQFTNNKLGSSKLKQPVKSFKVK